MPRFRKLLVPLDLQEESGATLEAAERMARQEGAMICLLHVVPGDEGAEADGEARQAATERLESIARRRREEGLRWDVLVVAGKPADRIVEVARDEGFDLILLAKRSGGSRIREWLLGGTAYQVVRRAGCGVLVVRD